MQICDNYELRLQLKKNIVDQGDIPQNFKIIILSKKFTKYCYKLSKLA